MGIFSWGKKALQNIGGLLAVTKHNSNIAMYPKWDIADYAPRYCSTDDIYSIVKMIATKTALIPIYGYLVKDEPAHKKLAKIKQPHTKLFETKLLQTKALEDLPEMDRVNQLLENPHETLSKFEFFEAINIFLLLFGEAFIVKERPDLGVNQGFPMKLHFMYPQHVILRVTDTFPRKLVCYDYRVNGYLIHEGLPLEDVIHIKYFNPDMDIMGNELRGLSPLMVLKKRLARLDSNMDTSVAQLQNGGVETIVFDKSPLDQQAKEIIGQRKDNFYRFLRNPSNAGAPFFAAGEMGAIQLGLSLADLTVADLAKIDFKKLCNAFSVSDRLFNNDATGSEVSDDNARKGLYLDACLPNIYRIVDAFKAGLLPDFEKGVSLTSVNENGELEITKIPGDGKKRDLQCDLSEITVLQQNFKDLAQWLAASWWITPNEKREVMRFDVINDPLLDVPLIPANLSTAEQMQAIPDLPIPTPNGN